MSDQPPESEPILETARNDPELVDVEKVLSLLDMNDGQARNEALMTLVHVADHDPDLVVEHTDRFVESLDDGFPVAESSAAQVLSRISPEYPERVVPAIPRLVEMLDDVPPLTGYRAGRALVPLLGHAPEEFVPKTEKLVEVLTDPPNPGIPSEEELDQMPQEQRKQIEERLEAREDEARKDIARTFGIREFTANALVEVTEREPERVAPHVGELAEWVDDGPTIVRGATIDAIANVAQHDQSAVEPAVDALIRVARTDANSVRAHAIQALGYAGATEAVEPLREVAASDDAELDEDVKDLAAETADFLENEA